MITEIQTNFYRITLRMPYRLRHVHAYLLAQDKELALFDTGLNMPGSYETLEKDLASIGFSINAIRHIFLTHVHTDHCSMAGLLQKNTDAKIYLSAAAFAEYQHFRRADSAVNQARQFYSRHGMSSHEIDAVIEEYEDMRGIITEFTSNNYLQNNELRKFGERKFEVIFTPGHATGHVCFLFRKEELLLAGDHILPYIAPSLSPNIFDENFRPLQTYLDSLSFIEKLPSVTIHPGHGNSFGSVIERLSEIRSHHAQRKELIFGFVNGIPKTTYVLAKEIFGSNMPDFEKFMALNETHVYLKELTFEGAIKEKINGGILVYTAC
ncbi:MAG: MBL fold metallo-hydrolase [Smithellaceae bacterium]|jgi:glyoxylase-like metal-dependent hydrolase (beta-lactamase superfamily II)